MLSGLLAVVWLALASPQDAACLGCHADPSVVGGQGKHLLVDARRHSASVHGALECTTCHDTIHDYPHPAKRARSNASHVIADERVAVDQSIHGAALGSDACQSCHGAPHDIPKLHDGAGNEARVRVLPRRPRSATTRGAFTPARLGTAMHAGATCRSCHGPSHGVAATSDSASPVSRLKIADTLRHLPRESRLPGTAQDPVRASRRGVQAERSRARPGRGQREGGLVQRLSRQPCRAAGTRRRLEDQSLAGARDMRDVSFEDPRRLCRTACTARPSPTACLARRCARTATASTTSSRRASQAASSTPLASRLSRAGAAMAMSGLRPATTCRSTSCRHTRTVSTVWR